MGDISQLPEFKKLSKQRQRFVLAYIRTGNGSVSAIEAGYSENGARVRAHELLTNSNIAYIIQQHAQNTAKKSIASIEEIQEMLTGIARTEDAEGVTMSDRLKAMDQLAKTQGGYLNKLEVSGELKLTDLSEEEMKAELAQLANAGILDGTES